MGKFWGKSKLEWNQDQESIDPHCYALKRLANAVINQAFLDAASPFTWDLSKNRSYPGKKQKKERIQRLARQDLLNQNSFLWRVWATYAGRRFPGVVEVQRQIDQYYKIVVEHEGSSRPLKKRSKSPRFKG